MRISRRTLTLGLAAALATPDRNASRADSPGLDRSAARGESPTDDDALELRTLHLEHEVLLALPRAPTHPVPLVVLLHGLAETSDEHTGARAWIDRYGLAASARRLSRAPVAPISSRDDWGGALATANAALTARPYRGLGFACPYVPRVPYAGLDGYAQWIEGVLIPRVRAEAGERLDATPARIGGCSYGGWMSLEVFLRATHGFSAWAGVQTAIAQASVAAYADRLARLAAGRPLLVETSARDPFHDPSVALAEALRVHNVRCELLVLPGPHDQPWLRESGTPSLLAWLDRA